MARPGTGSVPDEYAFILGLDLAHRILGAAGETAMTLLPL